MRCSVVISTYNRAGLLAYTLDSLVRQDIASETFEVIVVDDGSVDDSKSVTLSFQDRLRIQYHFQEDRGYRVSLARNVGIRASCTDVCVILDAGIILQSGCVRAHCEAHEASSESLAVCGYVYGFNEDNEDAQIIQGKVNLENPDSTMALFEATGTHLDLREEFYKKYGDEFAQLPAPWLVFWACNVSVRRDFLFQVGLFDEHFVAWGGEDVDLAYRLFEARAHFVLCRAAASIHYPHEKSYERNMREAAGNYRYIAAKYGTPITSLVVDNHFWIINDIIRRDNLPTCKEYLIQQKTATTAKDSFSPTSGRARL